MFYTYVLYSMQSPALSTHFFPSAAAALYSSLLRRCTVAVTSVLISPSDWNRLLQFVIPHVITWGETWKLEWMCQKFWLFTANSQSQLILHECALIMATDCRSNWHGMVKNKSILAEEHDRRDFQSTLTALCNFISRWRWGTSCSILSFLPEVKWI
jgi:hypothetical protein